MRIFIRQKVLENKIVIVLIMVGIDYLKVIEIVLL